ncbi:lanthionine synthetase C family protein [Amycolatopsis sp. NPDC004079]|uniref:lanthionine synthetase C family protein n=1 Tax=Amycolatopsis sp. NPDC004079 TaxID=3154549 RepID=UPI0033BBFA6D
MTEDTLADVREFWHGAVPADIADRALSCATEIAHRLSDPDRLLDLIVDSADQSEHPMAWQFPAFAHGHAGVALVHLHAAQAAATEAEGEALRQAAFDRVREAFTGTRAEPLDSPSLFAGIAGLALVLTDFAAYEARFEPSLERLHAQLAAKIAEQTPKRVERAVADSDYDMISGAAGVLAYLCSVPEPSEELRIAGGRLADYLIWLGEPPADPSLHWRWLVAPEFVPPAARYRAGYPGGYLNVGLSHGLPGVVAALAAAWRTGIRRPGHLAALGRMIDWLMGVRTADEDGPMWPADIPVDAAGACVPVSGHDQLSWCYGTAGVSAALLAAADALDDDALRASAVESFEAVLKRTEHSPITSPTLCHGMAGVLLICLDFAARTDSATASEAVPVLLTKLLAFADPDRPLLFADEEISENLVDSPALLSGASGVALTLLTAVAVRRPAWLRAFLTR